MRRPLAEVTAELNALGEYPVGDEDLRRQRQLLQDYQTLTGEHFENFVSPEPEPEPEPEPVVEPVVEAPKKRSHKKK